MRPATILFPALLTAVAGLGPGPLAGQSSRPSPGPQSREAARRAAHGQALGVIGASGLRGLLSSSGNLGDLRNRAGSYRTAVGLEEARTGALRGRIAALEEALADEGLSPERHAVLSGLRDAALGALGDVPAYDARYRTATAQAEALLPFGFAADRPLFLMVRGRGHARWGGDDGLTVFSEGVSAGPVLLFSDRWIAGGGLAVGRTDVEIGAFDGRSSTTSVGPTVNLGGVVASGWSVAAQLGYAWARSASRIVRPGPGVGTTVRSEGWSRTASAKAEVQGRLDLPVPSHRALAVRPRVGAFLITAYRPPSRNSIGERATGPFGERETLAALRAGAALEARLGPWRPSLYLGWERELTDEMSVLVHDPEALLASAGLSWSWARGRRLLTTFSALRGLEGLRRTSELTLVLVLDG